jgi:hypothetical protein
MAANAPAKSKPKPKAKKRGVYSASAAARAAARKSAKDLRHKVSVIVVKEPTAAESLPSNDTTTADEQGVGSGGGPRASKVVVPNIGQPGSIKLVAKGFMRNYLRPNGYAVPNTRENHTYYQQLIEVSLRHTHTHTQTHTQLLIPTYCKRGRMQIHCTKDKPLVLLV